MAAFFLVTVLAGCGFHLRGEANYTFQSIFVSAAGAPTLAAELRRALAATGSARIVDDPKNGQVILDIPLVADDKEVLSLSGGGSVREYLLIKRVQFRLHDADGNEWLPPGEISLRRSYTFSESEVLARDTQEQRLLKDMQTDAVQQLVRRLQAAKNPA
jgi:LPS-assembly lipoprotein